MGPKYWGLRVVLDEAAQRSSHAMELSFAEIDAMVGSLPQSARIHRTWWANGGNSQSEAWRSIGWSVKTVDLRLQKVRFTRELRGANRSHDEPVAGDASTHIAARQFARASSSGVLPAAPFIVLIGCVKTKLSIPAPAKELYTSPLFVRRRAYAERSMKPWFVLSSRWGLIDPDQIIAPYDMYLADQPASYRQAWGVLVVEQLLAVHPIAAGNVVEIHAGKAYMAAVKSPMESMGLVVTNPVKGTSLGQILQWYDANHEPTPEAAPEHEAFAALSNENRAIPPTALNLVDDDELSRPGLYAWWVDADGAAALSTGLGTTIEPGLLYVGETGATRQPSGRDSKNTLRARLNGILKGRVGGSTFRQSLDAILRRPLGLDAVDEARLSTWMYAHLRVTTWATSDVDMLGQVASRVQQMLDPPLNLQSMMQTDTRTRLSQLRKEAALPSGRPPAPVSRNP